MADRERDTPNSTEGSSQDKDYRQAIADYGPALDRLARAYEADPDLRHDLLQDIHFALWRSFSVFGGRCSVRTWTYRITHNISASHVARRSRLKAQHLMSLEDISEAPSDDNPELAMSDQQERDELLGLIQSLKSPDRQIILLYLEELGDVPISVEIRGAGVAG